MDVITFENIYHFTEEDGQEIVAICPNDGVYPNYYNCSTFITCSNGIQYIMECPEGLIWNVEEGKCDWPYNTDCVTYPGIEGIKYILMFQIRLDINVFLLSFFFV